MVKKTRSGFLSLMNVFFNTTETMHRGVAQVIASH